MEMIMNGAPSPAYLPPCRYSTCERLGQAVHHRKLGRIRIYENGQLSSESFLDITDRVNDSGKEMGSGFISSHYEQNGSSRQLHRRRWYSHFTLRQRQTRPKQRNG
jgi:hypothetical protein